ncbi:ExbD/TolR family protein [Photobacterium damselae]|uniref:ExbD/TolR family protein n=1 Tax=Photobacterium damselae TaxID=38293 RepID=UPI004068F573
MNNFLKNKNRHPSNELDVTAFLGLMIVLVPILLVSVKFTVLADISVNASSNASTIMRINNESKQKILKIELYSSEIKLYIDDKLDKVINWDLLNEFHFDKLKDIDDSMSVVIKVQNDIEYQKVIDVLDLVNKNSVFFGSISVDYNG